jgi:hypothetical protein
MLSMMNTKLAKGEKSDEDPKRKVGYREIKRREKTMKDYARKGAKRTTATTLNQKKFRERERERDPERTSVSFSYRLIGGDTTTL